MERNAMEKQVIEHAGQPVGVALHQDGKVKFMAVKYHVMDLDDVVFNSIVELRGALARLKSIGPRAAA
jgi:hypothetical protein